MAEVEIVDNTEPTPVEPTPVEPTPVEPTPVASNAEVAEPKRYFSFIGDKFDLTSHYKQTRSDNFIIAYTNKYDVRRRLNWLNAKPEDVKIVELCEVEEVPFYQFDMLRDECLDITRTLPVACLKSFLIKDCDESWDVENNTVTYTNVLGEKRVEVWESNLVKSYVAYYANGNKMRESVPIYNDKLEVVKTYYAKFSPFGTLLSLSAPDRHVECYTNGVVKTDYKLVNGKINGTLVSRHANGNLSYVANYNEGVLNGPMYRINHNNTILTQSVYENGVMQKINLSLNIPEETKAAEPSAESAAEPAAEPAVESAVEPAPVAESSTA
jgi:antitoxin component YwqK of YwqJK toxin-antitoxin module